MSKLASVDQEAVALYATFWRMTYMSVRKHHGGSTRELLTVVTIALLVKAGRNPTISDLTDITGIPKSNISRYVSRQMKAGFLTEVLDTDDRRRRCLHLTRKGQKEAVRIEKQARKTFHAAREVLGRLDNDNDLVTKLQKMLLNENQNSLP